MHAATTGFSRDYEVQRYTEPRNILRSEIIYGEGFQSPGGLAGFQATLGDRMALAPGMRLLDIGSGLGGAAFYLSDRYDVEVVGLDTAPRMTELSVIRQTTRDPRRRVRFVNGDVHDAQLDPGSFDLIYSRDVLMYEHAKPALFARCHALLKPGGRLLVTDFCRHRSSAEFDDYMAVSGYDLKSIDDYARLIAEAGFARVEQHDLSALAQAQLTDDLRRYRARQASGDPAIDEADAGHIVERWQRKIRFMKAGWLTQGLFMADKA
ncbi:methyltransferase domain-containing protein [Burkholderia glumae]|uniref:Methyltransferase domain-containing protein n=1 Tax=Burkholderia glumae TaxID=337 RepID=A0AAP9XWZ9_BURGL|nr:methyltransferase domain-containing protein [Burkholderia glumae]ACR32095.1 Cyclopropane-fatty-acyl-phospholipid synthase [Burkholderia glumae BGR1]AJY64657.1 ubiE/COQ5 methyltransferase family protein [Burkholderia glumae LMG 2196 = ATCC 33617]KHJ61485.1 methyltransferase [Burkholderia glumae]MCM2484727.1 methyltransferase domain-containing protein [Burkholderia glumae]MCM2495110.1 methyltransferase domain-containing protein [Burkholderia glumae]